MPAQVFGRIGTKGQTLVKSLDSPERALREAEKLIAEKLRKGIKSSGLQSHRLS